MTRLRNPEPWTLPMFAYGVNTNIQHLKLRCPEWDGQWCSARLDGHRMRFEKAYPGAMTSFCNIQEEPDAVVFGVLLWLDEHSFKMIDSYEGFPKHYDRKLVVVETRRLGQQKAWVYFSEHVDASLPPSRTYYRNVMAGLKGSGAPKFYLDSVARDALSKTLSPL